MAITYSELVNTGRMGNQIFQMCATICLALNNNDQYIFPSWKYEPYFNLHGCFTHKPTFSSTQTAPTYPYDGSVWIHPAGYYCFSEVIPSSVGSPIPANQNRAISVPVNQATTN